jgi:hypothetical protein
MSGPTLIFKWKGSGLKSRRTTKEKELQAEGWGRSLTEEQMSKCDFAERQLARRGVEKNVFLPADIIDRVE